MTFPEQHEARLDAVVNNLEDMALRLDALEASSKRPEDISYDRSSRKRPTPVDQGDESDETTATDDEFPYDENNYDVGGDFQFDATLYHPGPGGRQDFDVFESLYGVHPSLARRIRYAPTIRVLNSHATVVAKPHRTPSILFETAFRRFVRCLKECDYPDNFLVDPEYLALLGAYVAFLQAERSELESD
ncbi:hypothetical protein BO70DRAFT_399244 [Aspergillus heteromorphus CBS 117.55]|uniref:Uncharacterized protein n=1 Tax=Aspergillus heteromorphus CBS 117.55 TaxID=1448321 RepID=A0A317VDB4_9EURO|nr:uncharacterized protein BO70DRAFT_399244 [Aspergillus heteromorphus CBS 117.55]PWY72364.1 hypothetical protein BO70DRAFT_399244 [Aspergillus heteromorphus CBS 117.55]